MNQPAADNGASGGRSGDRARLRRLVSAACDGALSPSDEQELGELLKRRRDLVPDYADYIATEALIEQSCGVSFLEPPEAGRPLETSPSPPAPHRERSTPRPPDGATRRPDWRTSLRTVAAAFVLAASLVAVVGVGSSWLASHRAAVVAVREAEWDGDAAEVGESVGSVWLGLRSGSADFALRSGAMVSVQGPARVRFTGSNRCEVEEGAVAARVGAGAAGFRVDTPYATVIDRGTALRLLVSRESASTTVHVTEGSVAISDAQGGPELVLAAGEMGVGGAGGVSRDQRPQPKVSGAVALHKTHPTSLGYKAFSRDDRLALFLESSRVTLPHDVVLNLAGPGVHTELSGQHGLAKAGTVVDCYLIHSSPLDSRHLVRGSIVFPGEVLGVICDGDRLNSTNSVLGSPWSLRCEHPERGMESEPDRNSDSVIIGRDRRTLTVGMRTESIDQMRILVSPGLIEKR